MMDKEMCQLNVVLQTSTKLPLENIGLLSKRHSYEDLRQHGSCLNCPAPTYLAERSGRFNVT